MFNTAQLEVDLTRTKIMDLICTAGYNRPVGSGQ